MMAGARGRSFAECYGILYGTPWGSRIGILIARRATAVAHVTVLSYKGTVHVYYGAVILVQNHTADDHAPRVGCPN